MANNNFIEVLGIILLWIYRFFDWAVNSLIFWINSEWLKLFMLSIIVSDIKMLFERRQKKGVVIFITILYSLYSLVKIIDITMIQHLVSGWGILILIPIALIILIPNWLKKKYKIIELSTNYDAMHFYFCIVASLWIYYDELAGNLPITLIVAFFFWIIAIFGGKYLVKEK
jgi:hypothetical protein